MKKLLLIVLGVSTLISIGVIFWFKGWVSRINETMPPEGRAIFAQIDPEKCSPTNCRACAPELCEQQTPQGTCVIQEYKWAHGDKGYLRNYCDSAAASK